MPPRYPSLVTALDHRPLQGLKVAFICLEGLPNPKGSGARIPEVTRALYDAGAQVTVISLAGKEGRSLPAGVAHEVVPLAEQNYLSRALLFKNAVYRRLCALRPDVVHVRGPFEGEAALRYGEEQRARVVFEVNGLPSVELRYHYPALAAAPTFESRLRALEARVLEGADLVVTQSQATARYLRLRGASGARVVVVPNGADPSLFTPSSSKREDGPVRVLYAGTLAPWQGLHELLMALRRAGRGRELVLEVIGPARKAWQRELERRARRWKVDDRLTLSSPVSVVELADRVRAADICAVPLSRDRRNRAQGCSPLKLFEYMAAGSAVLATDLPCLREIVDDGRTGLLARAGHSHRLADALGALADDAGLRERLGKAARRYIEREATWTSRRALVVDAYEELLAPARARASA